MEAAPAVSRLPARLRARSFERECERLRPLGEAYALRYFAGQLGRADAEDVVAEVLIRMHLRAQEGRPAENLRAMFFTSVRNAGIDLLRSRSARPATVGLEMAAGASDAAAVPAERAEGREDALRLQEALARMRGSYRETILLRFGLGLTVPEIAAHFEISVAAAKKRVLRAGAQVRKRIAAIEGEEFCPQMRELARGFAFEKQASSLASAAEAEALRAHFSHCGPCRSYLAQLRGELLDLGSVALAALLAGHRLSGKVEIAHQLGHWAGGALDAAQGAGERLRHLALRAGGPFSSGDGAAGAVMGSGQKIAAICGAGAAATATCLLSGAVGPGIGAAIHPSHPAHRPAPKVKRLSSQDVPLTPVPAGPTQAEPAPSPDTGTESASPPRQAPPEAATPPTPPKVSESVQETSAPASEFGIEGGSTSEGASSRSGSTSTGSATESPPASARPSGGSGGGESAGGSGGSGSAATGGSLGFQG